MLTVMMRVTVLTLMKRGPVRLTRRMRHPEGEARGVSLIIHVGRMWRRVLPFAGLAAH